MYNEYKIQPRYERKGWGGGSCGVRTQNVDSRHRKFGSRFRTAKLLLMFLLGNVSIRIPGPEWPSFFKDLRNSPVFWKDKGKKTPQKTVFYTIILCLGVSWMFEGQINKYSIRI
jgi:hypothetical protein